MKMSKSGTEKGERFKFRFLLPKIFFQWTLISEFFRVSFSWSTIFYISQSYNDISKFRGSRFYLQLIYTSQSVNIPRNSHLER